MENVLEIKKGWFRSAGNVYKWTPDYHIFGVGIEKNWFYKDEIVLYIEGNYYKVNGKVALDFVKHYKAFYEVMGKRLGVISKSILEKID